LESRRLSGLDGAALK